MLSYAGIIRIRSMGMISARISPDTPAIAISAAKIDKILIRKTIMAKFIRYLCPTPDEGILMLNFKTLIISALALCWTTVMSAREGKVQFEARAGHSGTFGAFFAPSLLAEYSLEDYFTVSGGVQYSTVGKTSLEVCPAYFHDLNWGRISAEALIHYTHIFNLNNFAAGAGVYLKTRWIDARLGYYYRLYGNGKASIREPFNIYYRGTIHCLPMSEKWDLDLTMSNCETFELERHYQPSFIIQGWHYPKDFLGITLGVNYTPAGMLHRSADYYKLYTNAGICYRW